MTLKGSASYRPGPQHRELASDQTLGVEDGVVGVHGDLVLGGVTNETLGVGEGDKEGVVRLPWSLAMISMRSSRKTPTQE